MAGAGILVEAARLALAALGLATAGMGLRGFGPGGVPVGCGLAARGRAGKLLGALLLLLGLAMLAPAVWCVISQWRG
jgi:hypothetical protein